MRRVVTIALLLGLPDLVASPMWVAWLPASLSASAYVVLILVPGFVCPCWAIMLGHGAIRGAPDGSIRAGLLAGIALIILQAILIARLVATLMSPADDRMARLLEWGTTNDLIGFLLTVMAALVLSAMAAALGYLFGRKIGSRGALAAWSVQVLCLFWFGSMKGVSSSSPMLAAFGMDWVVPFATGLAILHALSIGALASTALLAGALHRAPHSSMTPP